MTTRDAQSSQFGKVLFERTRTVHELQGLLFLAALLLVAGVVGIIGSVIAWFVLAARHEDIPGIFAMCLFAVFGSIAVFAYCWLLLHTSLHCYELGIIRKTPLGTSELRFDELEALAFIKQRRMSSAGTYLETQYMIRFDPLHATRKRSIDFAIQVNQGREAEIEHIRDHVAEIISERLMEEFDRSGATAWTPETRILREGIEFLVRGKWVQIPWDRIQLTFVGDHWLEISDSMRLTNFIRLAQVSPNFYPGLLLVLAEVQKLQPASPPSSLQSNN